jgi:sarcosine oxidase, subunit beta
LPSLSRSTERDGAALPGETEVAVIGGGIAGCAALYYLTRAGLQATLLERGSVNRGASGGTGSNLHLQLSRYTEGMTRWKGNQLSARELYLHQVNARLHLEAAALWQDLETELSADLGVRTPGGLMVAETEDERRMLEAKSALENKIGIESVMLTGAQARAVEPALSPGVLAALLCPGEGFANALRTAPAFAADAARRGARVIEEAGVNAIEPDGAAFRLRVGRSVIRARTVVNAAGWESAAVAALVGTSLPVTSRYLQVCVTEPWKPVLSHYVAHTTRRLTLKQMPAGQFLLSGGWPGAESREPGGRGRVLAESMRGSAAVALRVIPALREVTIRRAWVAKTLYNDGNATILGRDPRLPRLFHLVPLTAGFALAPVLGRLLAELVQGGTPSLDIEPFAVGLPTS